MSQHTRPKYRIGKERARRRAQRKARRITRRCASR